MELLSGLQKDKEVSIATHSGSFHTDEIFAVAALSLVLDAEGFTYRVVRTRDEELIKSADIVCDVGGVYDATKLRFDHHQKDSPAPRSGFPYSSFGLIWKHFGMYLCKENLEIWSIVEERVAYPIDAHDNGVELCTPLFANTRPFLFNDIVFTFRPLRSESNAGDTGDKAFLKFVELAREYISRRIQIEAEAIEDRSKALLAYQDSLDKRVIVLEEDVAWYDSFAALPEPLYVVSPKRDENGNILWRVEAVREDPSSFKNKKSFPESWRGLTGENLEHSSGIPGALFCHRAGFLLTATTKVAAIALANIAASAVLS